MAKGQAGQALLEPNLRYSFASRRWVHSVKGQPSPRSGDRALLGAETGVALRYPALVLTIAALLAPLVAYANPEGGRVVAGAATLTQSTPQRIDIHQSSDKAIIDWRSFSIAPGEHTHFQQPSSSAATLNRVTGTNPSQILGQLTANGRVMLVNRNGVFFGKDSRVDVGALMATTADIRNEEFLAGRHAFDIASANPNAAVVNLGEIRVAEGGFVVLAAPHVRNEGVIAARLGQIELAGAETFTVDFDGDGLMQFDIGEAVKTAPEDEDGQQVDALVSNPGTINADGGVVTLTASAADQVIDRVINMEGVVEARTVETRGGEIILGGGDTGEVHVAGRLDASGAVNDAGAAGGRVRMTGRTVNLRGEVKGKDITASATDLLQQGRIVAPGGQVELSAANTIYLDGEMDVSDPLGSGGRIGLTTGRLEGMASGSLRADGMEGGTIHVQGRGSVGFSSSLSATGTVQGGTIEVTGDTVTLLNADVDASGGGRGGTIHLGGGWQGGGNLPHAREVLVGVGSEIRANGTSGDASSQGGEVVIWSDEASENYGSLQALDGGRIEFSSKGELRATGDIQAGNGGTVLFDPKNLIITDSPPDNLTMVRRLTSVTGATGMPGLANGDSFSSVALDGDRLVVGAALADTGGTDRGEVHLFSGVGSEFSELTWQKKLASGAGAIGMPALADIDHFGASVALDGDRLAVGANFDSTGGSDRGAVHLFTGVGTDFSGLIWHKKLVSGAGAIGMPALVDGDAFGNSIALDGERLAVGAFRDDFGGPNRGAVHLFTGVGSDFSGLAYQGKLASGTGALGMPALADSDGFGEVALDGDRMAVGAPFDDTSGTFRGAVYLYTGVGSDFSGLVWADKLTSGAGATGMPALQDGGAFGGAVALNGDRLAVGASGDDSGRGAVHLFTGVGSDFSGLTWQKRLGSETGAAGMPALDILDRFSSVALDGDRLAVGAPEDGSVGFNPGAVYLFTGLSTLGGISVSDATFGLNPSGTSYISPDTITALLDAGTAVTLQANNDIQVLSPLNVDLDTAPGHLTLQAGRNVDILAGIDMGTGDFTAVAGAPGADPAHTDPGTPLLNLSDATFNLYIGGTGTLAAVGGNLVGSATGLGRTAGLGRWLLYASDPETSIRYNFDPFNKHYNQPFTLGSVPAYADTGDWHFYSVVPILSVAPEPQSITYGENASTFEPQFTGFISDDTPFNAGFSGSAGWSIGGDSSSSGNLTAGSHEVTYASGLASSLGYQFADNPDSTNELTVNARDLTAIYTSGLDKTYDATTAAEVAGPPGNILVGDFVNISESAAFRDKNVGTEKPIDITNIVLTGADAANYRLTNTSATVFADINPLGGVVPGYTGIDKVYDATTVAQVISTVSGILPGDSVGTSESAAFRDKNAGTNKPIDVTDIVLTGADAGNYFLFNNTATAFADITPLGPDGEVVASYTGVDKVYDATTAAEVISALSGILSGDSVGTSESAAFRDKNVGTNKPIDVTDIVLTGADAGNYLLFNDTATAFADITPLGPDGEVVASYTGVDKVYDATTAAEVISALSGILSGDSVGTSESAAFRDKNVGTNKPIDVTGIMLTGADAGNYILLNDTAITTADITPAMLTYVASPASGVAGLPVTGLTGTLSGFLPGDTKSSETTGILVWTTPATLASPPGSYAIEGGGLAAVNYYFVQALGNATALALEAKNVITTPSSKIPREAVSPPPEYNPEPVGEIQAPLVSDEEIFAPLNLAEMTSEEMQQVLAERREFKKRLFSEAILKLEEDSSLADVPPCESVEEIDTGLCMITEEQRNEATGKPVVAEGASARTPLTTIARLPQIKRKVAVLFGINDYVDSSIPALINSVPDAEAVGKLLSERLGYEVYVIRNSTKADIVRSLNRLTTKVHPQDSVIVYYAGHGDVIEKTGHGYWIPSDASPTDPALWISNSDISKMLAVIDARQVAMISDSCYSGAFTKEEKVRSGEARINPEEVLKRRSVVVMSSGGDEPVADEGKYGHSIFAWYLMQDLGKINNWQPGETVFREVRREVSSAFPQTPQYGAASSAGHQQGGDYLFEFRQLEPGE